MTKQKGEALVYVKEYQNQKYRGRKGRVPRYAAIQYFSPLGAFWQAKSGDPHWLKTVTREAKEKYGVKLRGHIQKFVGSGGKKELSEETTKLKERNKELRRKVAGLPNEAARWAVKRGKSIAPRDTGSLIGAITYTVIKR